MKLFFSKKGKRRGKSTSSKGGSFIRALTELPPAAKFGLALCTGAMVAVLALWGIWSLFNMYYFRSRSLFVLRDLHTCVAITTGKTLTPDLVCEVLGLHEGVNLFSIPIQKKRRELLDQAPNIKEMSIVRRLPDKLHITIVEREPIARLGNRGQVVDEDGVVFIRYAGTGGMPQIKGSDTVAEFMPGDRLRGHDLAAVRVVQNVMRPDCGLRLATVDAAHEDYLLLTFIDNRQARLAWDGMTDGRDDSQAKLRRQLKDLEKAMETEMGRASRMLNATLPGRIFASVPGAR